MRVQPIYRTTLNTDWRTYQAFVRDLNGATQTLSFRALSQASAQARAQRAGYTLLSLKGE